MDVFWNTKRIVLKVLAGVQVVNMSLVSVQVALANETLGI